MSRWSRLAPRGARPPTERDWERSAVLEPRLVAREPEMISDGGGLPFAPSALTASTGSLDQDDPAVSVLLTLVSRQPAAQGQSPPGGDPDSAPPPASVSLAGWRQLVRTDSEVLFARGLPPGLVTVAVQLDDRGRTWRCNAVNNARPLRATRDGIRASSWRLDPTHELRADETVLRVLVTEQTFSGGQRAGSRVLAPDLYLNDEELVLTMFVDPKPGFQVRAPNPETPVRVALPDAARSRLLIDGALYDRAGGEPTPSAEAEAGV